ncbi:MAG: hypothetical protein WC776_05105 [Patescibacteria group bacterium]|jgi:hypothetical protein
MTLFSPKQVSALQKAINEYWSGGNDLKSLMVRLVDDNPNALRYGDGSLICDCCFIICYGPRNKSIFDDHDELRRQKDEKLAELHDLLSNYFPE